MGPNQISMVFSSTLPGDVTSFIAKMDSLGVTVRDTSYLVIDMPPGTTELVAGKSLSCAVTHDKFSVQGKSTAMPSLYDPSILAAWFQPEYLLPGTGSTFTNVTCSGIRNPEAASMISTTRVYTTQGNNTIITADEAVPLVPIVFPPLGRTSQAIFSRTPELAVAEGDAEAGEEAGYLGSGVPLLHLKFEGVISSFTRGDKLIMKLPRKSVVGIQALCSAVFQGVPFPSTTAYDNESRELTVTLLADGIPGNPILGVAPPPSSSFAREALLETRCLRVELTPLALASLPIAERIINARVHGVMRNIKLAESVIVPTATESTSPLVVSLARTLTAEPGVLGSLGTFRLSYSSLPTSLPRFSTFVQSFPIDWTVSTGVKSTLPVLSPDPDAKGGSLAGLVAGANAIVCTLNGAPLAINTAVNNIGEQVLYLTTLFAIESAPRATPATEPQMVIGCTGVRAPSEERSGDVLSPSTVRVPLSTIPIFSSPNSPLKNLPVTRVMLLGSAPVTSATDNIPMSELEAMIKALRTIWGAATPTSTGWATALSPAPALLPIVTKGVVLGQAKANFTHSSSETFAVGTLTFSAQNLGAALDPVSRLEFPLPSELLTFVPGAGVVAGADGSIPADCTAKYKPSVISSSTWINVPGAASVLKTTADGRELVMMRFTPTKLELPPSSSLALEIACSGISRGRNTYSQKTNMQAQIVTGGAIVSYTASATLNGVEFAEGRNTRLELMDYIPSPGRSGEVTSLSFTITRLPYELFRGDRMNFTWPKDRTVVREWDERPSCTINLFPYRIDSTSIPVGSYEVFDNVEVGPNWVQLAISDPIPILPPVLSSDAAARKLRVDCTGFQHEKYKLPAIPRGDVTLPGAHLNVVDAAGRGVISTSLSAPIEAVEALALPSSFARVTTIPGVGEEREERIETSLLLLNVALPGGSESADQIVLGLPSTQWEINSSLLECFWEGREGGGKAKADVTIVTSGNAKTLTIAFPLPLPGFDYPSYKAQKEAEFAADEGSNGAAFDLGKYPPEASVFVTVLCSSAAFFGTPSSPSPTTGTLILRTADLRTKATVAALPISQGDSEVGLLKSLVKHSVGTAGSSGALTFELQPGPGALPAASTLTLPVPSRWTLPSVAALTSSCKYLFGNSASFADSSSTSVRSVKLRKYVRQVSGEDVDETPYEDPNLVEMVIELGNAMVSGAAAKFTLRCPDVTASTEVSTTIGGLYAGFISTEGNSVGGTHSVSIGAIIPVKLGEKHFKLTITNPQAASRTSLSVVFEPLLTAIAPGDSIEITLDPLYSLGYDAETAVVEEGESEIEVVKGTSVGQYVKQPLLCEIRVNRDKFSTTTTVVGVLPDGTTQAYSAGVVSTLPQKAIIFSDIEVPKTSAQVEVYCNNILTEGFESTVTKTATVGIRSVVSGNLRAFVEKVTIPSVVASAIGTRFAVSNGVVNSFDCIPNVM